MFKYKKVLLFVNRAVYLLSAAMLMAGLALSAAPQLAQATAIDFCGNIPGNQGSIPTGMQSDGTGNCVCQTGYVETGSGSSVYCILPTSTTPPDDQVCPHDGDWVKIDGLSSNSYTYVIPDGKEVVEVCYKAGNNTYTFSVIPPATGSITISNDQFANDNGQYHDLSHATFRVQDIQVEVSVCHVPDNIETVYSTETMTDTAWDLHNDTDTNDRLMVPGADPCEPPTTYVDVCHVPDAVETEYAQETMTSTAWVSHQARPDTNDFIMTLESAPCEPQVLVCKISTYETELMYESEWDAWKIDHEGDYTVDSADECQEETPKIWICHVPEVNPGNAHAIQVAKSSWNEDDGTGHAVHLYDFEITGPTDPACPPQSVTYCHYDQDGDTWTEKTEYFVTLTGHDYVLPKDDACPQKISPTVSCVWSNGDGSVDAVFAYNNPNAGTISIAIGADNDLSGSGSFLGGPPPTDFVTGNTSAAFVVSFLNMKTVSWFIKSPDFANGITATAAATGPACQEDPKKELKPVALLDPYCYSIPGTLMQWTVENENGKDFTVDSWTIDGVLQSAGFIAPAGESLLTTTALGTHTVDLYWGLVGHTSLTYNINSCALPDETPTPGPTPTERPQIQTTPVTVAPLPIPVTGQGGEIIPVTGADLMPFGNIWVFAGFSMFGFGMVLSGLRKRLGL